VKPGVTVRIWPAAPIFWNTRIELSDGTVYGQPREFDNYPAAVLHCSQMLRVLADESRKDAAA